MKTVEIKQLVCTCFFLGVFLVVLKWDLTTIWSSLSKLKQAPDGDDKKHKFPKINCEISALSQKSVEVCCCYGDWTEADEEELWGFLNDLLTSNTHSASDCNDSSGFHDFICEMGNNGRHVSSSHFYFYNRFVLKWTWTSDFREFVAFISFLECRIFSLVLNKTYKWSKLRILL